jgi:hypothetical protein
MKIKSIKQLRGGVKGVVFLLEDYDGKKLVVKFQKEMGEGPIIGTFIMDKVNVTAPKVHNASREDLRPISLALEDLKNRNNKYSEEYETFNEAGEKYEVVLFMQFVEGSTIGVKSKENPWNFLDAVCGKKFQVELGKILASDAFSGNPDHIWTGYAGSRETAPGTFEPIFGGWCNTGNLFVTNDKKLVPIDNAFSPDQWAGAENLIVGSHTGFTQRASIASCHFTNAKLEAEKLFDYFVAITRSAHPEDQNLENFLQSDALVKEREAFISVVSTSAVTTMSQLLERNQHWGEQFKKIGANQKLVDKFRIRKRVLRLAAAGVEADKLLAIAKDQKKYHHWFLCECKKMDEKQAALLLKDSKAYKEYKQSL